MSKLPVSRDVKAAHDLLTELLELRDEVKNLKRVYARADARAKTAERQLKAAEAKIKAFTKAKK